MKILLFLLFSIIPFILCSDSKKGKAAWITLNDGNKMPSFGFGTSQGFSLTPKEFPKFQIPIEDAIDAGYRLLDTAESYHNEDDIGKAVENKIKEGVISREDIFVITKLGNHHHARDQVLPALRESLKKLKLDYVDLYLMHSPKASKTDFSPLDIDFMETWEAMEECKKQGLAKSIGLSNFNEAQIERVLKEGKVKPAALEIEVNPTHTQKKLTDFSKQHGIVVIAYTPFGFMSIKSDIVPPPRFDDPTLTEMGKKYNKTSAQIVLRYLVERGLVPIPKSSSKTRIEQNIDIFDFHLTPEEMARVDKFNKDKSVFS